MLVSQPQMGSGSLPSQPELVRAGSYLLGLSQPDTPASTQLRKELATVLSTRLINHNAVAARWSPQANFDSAPSQPEPVATTSTGAQLDSSTSLQAQTARAATRILSLLVDSLNHAAPPSSPSASATSSTPAGAPPVFGQRDHQVLSQLAGVIARWGVSSLVRPGVLPRALSGPPGPSPAAPASSSRFAEVDEAAEQADAAKAVADELELEQLTRLLLEVTLPAKDAGQGRKELAAIVRMQVALPLVGALVQLAFGGTSGAAGWAREALDGMFARWIATCYASHILGADS